MPHNDGGVCLAYIALTTGVGATIFTQRDV